jgi:hypothetical protein
MGIISADTFDPTLAYISVRLQQGVPLVDADVNELDDIRKFEVRAFLKWFVGDGIPEGSDGFRIVANGAPNDVVISAGVPAAPAGTDVITTGLRHVGRCLVEGRDAIIVGDLDFRSQPLHVSQAGAAALAASWSVPTVPELQLADVTLLLYLDVWDRLVTPTEEPDLIFAGLGTESAARLRREWVVRWSAGSAVPGPLDPDFRAGHGYYPLAQVVRRAAAPNVFPADVTDLREQRLLVPPATLIEDVLGMDASAYRQGQSRPPISLRDAVNALLRGELPSSPDTAVAPDPSIDVVRRGLLFDGAGHATVTWQSDRLGGTNQVFIALAPANDPSAGFGAPEAVTSGAAHIEPHSVTLPNGDLLIAYVSGAGASADVQLKRAQPGALGAAAEVAVSATGGVAERAPWIVMTGSRAVIFYHLGSTNRWQFRRRLHATDAWEDLAGGLELSATTATRDFHAAATTAGQVFAAFRAGSTIRALRLDPVAGTISVEATHTSGAGVDEAPFVLPVDPDVWIFWQAPGGLMAVQFTGGAWQTVQAVPSTAAGDRQPSAVVGGDGAVWLFWTRGTPNGDLFVMRRDAATGAWGQPRQLSLATGDDNAPYAVVAPDRSTWLVWVSDRDGNANVYFRRLITVL